MENNFYRERPIPSRSGVVEGDAGKLEMYVSRDAELGGAKFACKPFDELFWSLETFSRVPRTDGERCPMERPG